MMRPLPPQTLHLPFGAGAYRMAMDLVTVPEAVWFEIDDQYLGEMAEKRRLLTAARDDVFAVTAESDAARQEALDVAVGAVVAHHPDWFARVGSRVFNRLTGESWDVGQIDPLDLLGRLVQEDVCLIQNHSDGPRLTAASLCFPSRWRLLEKIGKPLAAVHGPVPLYAKRLAGPVDRFMRHLKPGHIVSRLNWSLVDDCALFQPGGKWRVEASADITAKNAGSRVFLRVERQTLRRLPITGAVLFGIRVHVYTLHRVIDRPDRAVALTEAVKALPVEIQHYKSLLPFRQPLLAWLASVEATPVSGLAAG